MAINQGQSKKRLLIVNQNQFGYHIDYVQYSRYLKPFFDITFLCWNYELNRIEEEGINVLYISRAGNIVRRNFRFLYTVIKFVRTFKYEFVYIDYFRGCSLIPILFKKKIFIHLDIRSGSTEHKVLKRHFYNNTLMLESCFFKSISVISTGLRNSLNVRKSAYILPLGANKVAVERKLEHRMSLIYVGTLFNRRLEDTVKGLSIFLSRNPDADVHYNIIGGDSEAERQKLRTLIQTYKLDQYVSMKGYVPHSELAVHYGKANIGISYVPITPFYNFQPVTKTFEYLMAGLPVIATGTFENRQLINDQNGVIIEDTPEGFAQGMDEINGRLNSFDEEVLKESVSEYQWDKIVYRIKDEILSCS